MAKKPASKTAAANKDLTIDDFEGFLSDQYGAPLAEDFINMLKHVSMNSISSAQIDADDDEDADGNAWDNLDTAQLKEVAAALKIKETKKSAILAAIEAMAEKKPKAVQKAIDELEGGDDEELADDDEELEDDEDGDEDADELDDEDEELDDDEDEKPAKKGAKKAPAKAAGKKSKAAEPLEIALPKLKAADLKKQIAELADADVANAKQAVAYAQEWFSIKLKPASALELVARAEAYFADVSGEPLDVLKATAEEAGLEVDVKRTKDATKIAEAYAYAIVSQALEEVK